MAAPTTQSRPLRVLISFLVLTAALFVIMGITGQWTPKLGLDLRGGTTVTLTAANLDPAKGTAIDRNSLEQARTIIQSRVDSLGVGETEVSVSGDNQIVVSVPNVNEDELISMVGRTAILSFRLVYVAQPVQPAMQPSEEPSSAPSGSEQPSGEPSASDQPSGSNSEGNGGPFPELPTLPPTAQGEDIPADQAMTWQPTEADYGTFQAYDCSMPVEEKAMQPLVTCNEEGTEKYLLGPTIIEGKQLDSASAGVPQNDVKWVVDLQFNPEGSAKFEEATTHLSTQQDPMNRFAIVLDGKSISAPSVQNPIPGGQAQISGSFTQESAQNLANILKYGSLPLAFDMSSVENVSPTLGGEQLRAGMIAGIIGLALVLVYALLYYRGLALVVVTSLAMAAALTYAIMVLLGTSMGFALNLPGIAGAIVAIGTTADSFIIYFERIRDEVRDGRTLRTAIETGWARARSTILIADAVNVLSAIILFILAIGAVKGFAFTLGLTTVIDVAIVFWFTKPLMTLLGRTKFFGQGHRLSGLDPRHLGVDQLPAARRTATAGGKA
ncbi:protein translocase subunit SecD [Propionibacteriaceae bacterium Y1700]|uniref:protein translocase subunit SecD n=1 Tax=Microlunatus sp. Y1700 TaxID=3418487 RepID=UPI003DA78D7E